MDQQIWDNLYEKLNSSAYNVKECREHYFSGDISVSEGQNTVLTTIPYDKGWRVTANGKRIETYQTLDALLAFDLETGDYELELRYLPSVYIVGICLFMAGALTLSAIIVAENSFKKNKKAMAEASLPGKEP